MSNYTPILTNAAGVTKDAIHSPISAADLGTEFDAIKVATDSKQNATDVLGVAYGGTGAATSGAAPFALKGANTDITSLAGLTEPTGFRNKIINGNFDIWQRGTAAVTTHGAYGPDRWAFGSIGNSFSATQGAFVSGDALYDPTAGNTAAQYYSEINVTSVAGAANYTIIVQKIENVRVLAGKTVTVSFWAKAAAGTPTVGINLLQNFGGGGSADVSGAGQPIVLSTTWTKYTKTFTVGSLNGKTVGTSSHTVLNFWLDAGSNYTAVSGGITQASKIVSLAQVQLEAGSVATPFEHRPIGTELELCQRYLPSASSASGTYNGFGQAYDTTHALITVNFAVTPRVPPTSVNGSNHSITNAGAGLLPVLNYAINGQGNANIGTFVATVASGLVGGNATLLQAGVSSTLLFEGCEL